MSNAVNALVGLLKWPMALVMLVLLAPALLTLGRVGWQMLASPSPWWPLWAGTAVFALLWALWLRKTKTTNLLYTLEHELTHALFAVLTFNRVTDLNARRGTGHMAYEGRGNWLVSLAPYFFPTFCLPPLLALQFAVAAVQSWLLAMLGFALAMHVHATWHETHSHQPDLLRHGRLASWCILPGAMTAALVLVLAAVPGQSTRVWQTFSHTLDQTRRFVAHELAPTGLWAKDKIVRLAR